MDKTKILAIGIGRAGNVLLNELLKKDKRITGLFVNSSASDLNGLENMNLRNNTFLFPAMDGSGKDRKYAYEILKDKAKSLTDVVNKFQMQDNVFIFFSLDGGTGSGITPTFVKLLKSTCPNKNINLVGVLPDYNNSDKIALRNTIECWNEIDDLVANGLTIPTSKGKTNIKVINSMLFIDNSKRKTFKEINEEALNLLYDSFCMNGQYERATIDNGDITRAYKAEGYAGILKLDPKIPNIEDNIKQAVSTSVFALPNDLVCKYLAISTKDFVPTNFATAFECEETKYIAQNKTHNTILMTGCGDLSNHIEYIKMIYDDLVYKTGNKTKIKRTHISLDDEDNNSKNTEDYELSHESQFDLSLEDIDNIFDNIF